MDLWRDGGSLAGGSVAAGDDGSAEDLLSKWRPPSVGDLCRYNAVVAAASGRGKHLVRCVGLPSIILETYFTSDVKVSALGMEKQFITVVKCRHERVKMEVLQYHSICKSHLASFCCGSSTGGCMDAEEALIDKTLLLLALVRFFNMKFVGDHGRCC